MPSTNTPPEPRAPLPRWGTQQEAADLARVSVETIRRWASSGKITASRLGPRRVVIDLDSVAALAQPLRPDLTSNTARR
ncbi:helix-turn-helix domain-containing protein [Microbacterium natoriense]